MQSGVITKYFPTTGGRDDTGLLPAWTLRYIYTMKNREKEVMLNLGELSGSIPIHFREPDPNRKFHEKIISIDDRPTINFKDWNYKSTEANDKLTPISDDKGGWTVDRAHQPSLVFIPYIVTGDKYFLDEIYFWAAYNLGRGTRGRAGTKNLTPDMTGTLSDGIIVDQIRGEAWGFRNVAYGAIFGTDGDIEKDYFLRKSYNNIAQWHSYENKYPLKFWKVNIYTYPKSSDWNVNLKHTNAPWENDYMLHVLIHLNDLGMGTKPILNWFSQFIINRFSHPDFNWFLGASYQFPAVAADGEYIQTWKQAKECYLDQPTDFKHDDYPTSYRYNARAALSCLVDYPNGRKAYEFIDTHIHNKEDLRNNPKWAFLPKNESPSSKHSVNTIIPVVSSDALLKIGHNSSNNVKIQYIVMKYENIKIEVFDSKGKLLETPIDSLHQRGNYIYDWNTEKYGSGIFHIRYIIGKDTIVKNTVITK
jgi:hypothetical protein